MDSMEKKGSMEGSRMASREVDCNPHLYLSALAANPSKCPGKVNNYSRAKAASERQFGRYIVMSERFATLHILCITFQHALIMAVHLSTMGEKTDSQIIQPCTT